jgi:release factor glutamine methyltransferase
MTVNDFIKETTARLTKAGSTSARLDTLVLLSDEWQKDKAWLLAHAEQEIPKDILSKLKPKVSARAKRKPMAYIRGYQEFYGRDFVVNKKVLIPRPDSEILIDLLKPLAKKTTGVLVDIGTGSGALGITAALECPNLQVELTDIDPDALAVADLNALHFKLDLPSYVADVLDPYVTQPDNPRLQFIVANLPYVNRVWETSVETDYEPHIAIFADDGGLALVKKLIQQTPMALKPGGYLLLEADPRLHDAIISLAKDKGLDFVDQKDFTVVLKRPA